MASDAVVTRTITVNGASIPLDEAMKDPTLRASMSTIAEACLRLEDMGDAPVCARTIFCAPDVGAVDLQIETPFGLISVCTHDDK